jgi:lipoate-protein ligase A
LKYALKAMGLDIDRSQPYYQDRGPSGKAFYDGPSDFQVTVGGRKLVCGAMLSNERAVMIQCTLPLFGDIERITDVLNFDLPGERLALVARIGYRAATLESLLGKQPDYDEVASYLQDGFTKGLTVSLNKGDLTEPETSRAAILRSEKYTGAEWTKRN